MVLVGRANVRGVSCAAGPACRPRAARRFAAEELRPRLATFSSRDAVGLPKRQVARLPGCANFTPVGRQVPSLVGL
jgi:hypothetical protein